MSAREESGQAVATVICTYDRESEVCRAVESALAQTHAPAEIIVVDDGSTDGTRAALARFGNSIQYVHQENQGASAARNTGVGVARAPWIAFLDSDDLWLESHLEDLLSIVTSAEPVAWAFSTRLVRNDNREEPRKELPDEIVAPLVDAHGVASDYFAVAAAGIPTATSTFLIQRRVLEELAGFDVELPAGEDLDLWWRIARDHPRVGVSRRPSVIMERDRDDSLSGAARLDDSGASDSRFAGVILAHLEALEGSSRARAFEPLAGLHLDAVVARALERRDLEVLRLVGWKHARLLSGRRRLLFCLFLAGGRPGAAVLSRIRALRLRWKRAQGRLA
ncbi:MAG: glycosyltransferase family 2 protein [Myxococcota bacterium]